MSDCLLTTVKCKSSFELKRLDNEQVKSTLGDIFLNSEFCECGQELSAISEKNTTGTLIIAKHCKNVQDEDNNLLAGKIFESHSQMTSESELMKFFYRSETSHQLLVSEGHNCE